MKKVILCFILIVIVIGLPFFVYSSDDCGDYCNVEEDGDTDSGKAGASKCPPGDNCCSHPPCAWQGQDNGVRISLYEYNGTGDPVKVGSSVDIYQQFVKTNEMYITSPQKDDGIIARHGTNCKVNTMITEDTTSFEKYAYYKGDVLGANYLNQNHVYSVKGLIDVLKNQNPKPIGKWLYDPASKTGWIATNIFNPILNDNDYDSVAKMFSPKVEAGAKKITGAELKEKWKNIYIVAELLTSIKMTSGVDLFTADTKVYIGTVSQTYNVRRLSSVIKRMWATQPVGNLVCNPGESCYIHCFTNHSAAEINDDTLCNYANGMGIWKVSKHCCPDCGDDDDGDDDDDDDISTCEETCGSIPIGSAKRLSCAKNWCSVPNHSKGEYDKCVEDCNPTPVAPSKCVDSNICGSYAKGSLERKVCATVWCAGEDDPKACVDSCSAIVDNPKGCSDDDSKKTCTTYAKDGGGSTITTAKDTCETSITANKEEFETADVELSTTFCKSSGISNYIISSGKGFSTPYTYNYYRINCTETLKLTELPSFRNALNSWVSGVSSLYLGFTREISRECQLEYKKYGVDEWTANYNESQLKADIFATDSVSVPTGFKEEEKTALNDASAAINKELQKIQKQAMNQLESLADPENDSLTDGELTNRKSEVEIEYVREGKEETTHTTVQLIPVSCTDVETKKECINLNGEVVGTVEEIEKKCSEAIEPKVDTTKGSASYYEKDTMAVPDSYVEALTPNAGRIHHSLGDCESGNAIRDTNGLCVKKDRQWAIEAPVDEDGVVTIDAYNKLAAEEGFEVKINVAWGYCDNELKYDLKCNYKYMDKNACTSECEKAGYAEDSEEFKQCYANYCGCEAYCGSNQACRQTYCPTECEGCSDDEPLICDGACIGNCSKESSDTDSDEYLTCEYNCCSEGCTNDECRINCCRTACAKKKNALGWSDEEYQECLKPCPDPTEIDYLYRSVDIGDPFPGREEGQNWAGKVGYITKGNDSTSKYYDKTNGQNSDFEYRISLSSDDIKAIKKDNRVNKTYHDFLRADTDEVVSSISDKVYCSSILHEYDLLKGKVEFGTTSLGSGCKSKR